MPTVLIKFEKNYADEFDVYGMRLFDSAVWEKIVAGVKKLEWPIECNFGTNEEVIFDSADEFLRAFRVILLDVDEIAVLKKAFSGTDGFGWIPWCVLEEFVYA